MAATDLDALTQKRVDFESRINAIEKSNDVAALGTPEEQRTWARLKRIEDFVADASRRSRSCRDAREAASDEGVMYWRLSESFKARLWNERRSVKELEASLIETQKRAVLVRQARSRHAREHRRLRDRVGAMRARMDGLQARLTALTDKQSHYLRTRDRGARAPEAAYRDLSSSGALRARGDLRQDREQSRPATRQSGSGEPRHRQAAGGQAEEQEEVVGPAVVMRPALSAAIALGRRAARVRPAAGASASKSRRPSRISNSAADRRESRSAARASTTTRPCRATSVSSI